MDADRSLRAFSLAMPFLLPTSSAMSTDRHQPAPLVPNFDRPKNSALRLAAPVGREDLLTGRVYSLGREQDDGLCRATVPD